MELYCFASNSLANIWVGIGSKTWAVNQTSDIDMSRRITKASKIKIGSLGLLYCNETHSFTTPFIIYSKPNPNKVIKNIWSGSWVLPFKIFPLGNPEKQINKDRASRIWPIIKNSNQKTVSAAMNITGTTVFVPKIITQTDWEYIIQELATDI